MKVLRINGQYGSGYWSYTRYFLVHNDFDYDDAETLKDDYENFIKLKKGKSKKRDDTIRNEFTFERFLKNNYGFEKVDCIDFAVH